MKFAQVSQGSAICVEMELRTAYSESFSETRRMGRRLPTVRGSLSLLRPNEALTSDPVALQSVRLAPSSEDATS